MLLYEIRCIRCTSLYCWWDNHTRKVDPKSSPGWKYFMILKEWKSLLYYSYSTLSFPCRRESTFLVFPESDFSFKKSCRSPIGVGDDRINANHPWSTTQHFYVLRCTGKPCPSMRKKMSLRVGGSCIYSEPYLKHPLLLHIQSLTSPYLLTLSISLLHWWVIPKYIPSTRGDIHNTLNKFKTKKRQIYARNWKHKKIIKNCLDDYIILYYTLRV